MRRDGFPVEMAFRGNVKKRMQRANAAEAILALIFGDEELERDAVKLKDLETGEEREILIANVPEDIIGYMEQKTGKLEPRLSSPRT